MKKLKLIFYSFVLAGIVAALILRQQIFDYFGPQIQSIEKTATEIVIREISKNISTPPPLRLLDKPRAVPKGTAPTPLTLSGTIKWTNIKRGESGLQSLSENKQLDSVALLRLEDMFENQYFAHVSPTGSKAEKVARGVGYDYLALGENLALGNFDNDKDLIEAWMNSAGHRANILNTSYTEIGVAVKADIFSAEGGSPPESDGHRAHASGGEGKPVWIGVQIFGKPASLCPRPDETLKARIEAVEVRLKDLQIALNEKRAEIENSDRRGRDYNEKVAAYNVLVEQYNTLLAQTKDLISQYNSHIVILNQCIGA